MRSTPKASWSRPVPSEASSQSTSPAADAAGQAESAGGAIAFSGVLGGIYFSLQIVGLAPEGFIDHRALLLISVGFLVIGVVMVQRARWTMKRLGYGDTGEGGRQLP